MERASWINCGGTPEPPGNASASYHDAGLTIILTGRSLDHSASFLGRTADQLAHEALDALIAAGEAADIDQILPDGHGIASAGEPQFDGVPMHRAGAGRRRRRRRFGSRRYAKVGGHLYGRFCVGRVGTNRGGCVGRCRAGSQIGIRRGSAGTSRCLRLRAKVGGRLYLYGRFCRRWSGTGARGRCRQEFGDRLIGRRVCRPMSPQT